MKKRVLRDKSYGFAIEVVKLLQFLVSEKKEDVLSKQFVRSGTAIGALIPEAEFAQNKKDFISEIIYGRMHPICKEIIAMLVRSVKTTKSGLS